MQKGSPRFAPRSETGAVEAGQTQVLILAGIVILLAVAGGIFFLGRVTLPRQDSSGQAAPKPQLQTPVVSHSPQPSPTPNETVYTEQSRSANWKILKSEKCDFSLKYPDNWTNRTEPLSPPPGVITSGSGRIGSPEFQRSCALLWVPMPGIDYNEWGRDLGQDFYVYINRTLKGSIYYPTNITINSLDDLIKTLSTSTYNVRDKTFNILKGKYYEDETIHYFNFIFERGNYIYQITWPERTNDSYKKEVESIINSIKF